MKDDEPARTCRPGLGSPGDFLLLSASGFAPGRAYIAPMPSSPPYAIFEGIEDPSDTDTWADRGGTPLDGFELLINDDFQRTVECATLNEAKRQAELLAGLSLHWRPDDAGTLWGEPAPSPEA